MIVCPCHVLSDHDVRDAVNSADILPRSAKQLYGCLGCSAECGRCARTLQGILDEALGVCPRPGEAACPHKHVEARGGCARSCQAGCPHKHVEAEPDFALAAS